jgi:hypothetical protein
VATISFNTWSARDNLVATKFFNARLWRTTLWPPSHFTLFFPIGNLVVSRLFDMIAKKKNIENKNDMVATRSSLIV